MKTILRIFLASLFSLWVISNTINGFKINGGWQNYLLASAFFTFILIFIKPILKLLFLPINFFSLGLLSWLVNVAILYLLTVLVSQITISPWKFNGLSYQGITLPPYYFNQILTFIVVALVLSFLVNFINWLAK